MLEVGDPPSYRAFEMAPCRLSSTVRDRRPCARRRARCGSMFERGNGGGFGLQSRSRALTAVEWLLDGNPAIRWQTLRDLVDAPPSDVERERRKGHTRGLGRTSAGVAGRRRRAALGVPPRHLPRPADLATLLVQARRRLHILRAAPAARLRPAAGRSARARRASCCSTRRCAPTAASRRSTTTARRRARRASPAWRSRSSRTSSSTTRDSTRRQSICSTSRWKTAGGTASGYTARRTRRCTRRFSPPRVCGTTSCIVGSSSATCAERRIAVASSCSRTGCSGRIARVRSSTRSPSTRRCDGRRSRSLRSRPSGTTTSSARSITSAPWRRRATADWQGRSKSSRLPIEAVAAGCLSTVGAADVLRAGVPRRTEPLEHAARLAMLPWWNAA